MRLGWRGPAVVLATDLPNLTIDVLVWLVGHPGTRSVVPVVSGHPQPLCARYAQEDLLHAGCLVRAGKRALADLLVEIDADLVGEDRWPAGFTPAELADVDTPEELDRVLRSKPQSRSVR
jgi:molybdopterin-guanine dinucleotide biosynthesis protein A